MNNALMEFEGEAMVYKTAYKKAEHQVIMHK